MSRRSLLRTLWKEELEINYHAAVLRQLLPKRNFLNRAARRREQPYSFARYCGAIGITRGMCVAIK